MSDMTKVIRNETDYETALSRVEELIDLGPEEGSDEREELDLLVLLVEAYEKKEHALSPPDPVDAILFRMDQGGLTQRDLIPFIGSRSKVSEVLARKRPVTMAMARALHDNLGIPARSLLAEAEREISETDVDWGKFPIREILKCGWISAAGDQGMKEIKALMQNIFAAQEFSEATLALCRTSRHMRSARQMNFYALMAWTARSIQIAKERKYAPYAAGTVTLEFMREVARLSNASDGPLKADGFLEHHGIVLVTVPHLSRTYLDGAALLLNDQRPVVALTLRHDRIDNFWFCLLHELAHISLHVEKGVAQFYDDLDFPSTGDRLEAEADELASDALIPRADWKRSAASKLLSPEAAEDLAHRLEIHVAIVAGRMRHEFNNFRALRNLVGYGQVRKLFEGRDKDEV